MATRHTSHARTHTSRSIKSPRRSASRSMVPGNDSHRLQPDTPCRLRVPAAEAYRLRALLLSDDVGLIGSQDIRKLVMILEDAYPAPRPRRTSWRPLLMGTGIGLAILAGIVLVI